MDIHFIPFQGQFIIYRPLSQLAFLGNRAMVRHVKERLDGKGPAPGSKADAFLEAIGFWLPDPPPPAAWTPADAHRPTIAVLLMTSACNLRCTYCYARGGENSHLWMTLPLARRVIETACENAHALGQSSFSLAFHGGGEPTLNWEVLAESVRYTRDRDLPCHISMSTNGLWTEEQRRFILGNFDGLSLSFDGIQEVQDTQRPRSDGTSSFAAVMETIRALDRARFSYGIRMTVTPATAARLPESVSFLCDETRCRIIQAEPCYVRARGKYADPTPELGEAFARAFLKASRIAGRRHRTLFYSGARPWVIAASFCRAPEEALVVTPEGDIVTCFEAHDRRHPLLKRLAIGRASSSGVNVDAARIRAFSERQRLRRKACEGCFCYWHCGGDCASRCMSSGGKHRGRCQVNRRITRELLASYLASGNGVWRGEKADEEMSL